MEARIKCTFQKTGLGTKNDHDFRPMIWHNLRSSQPPFPITHGRKLGLGFAQFASLTKIGEK